MIALAIALLAYVTTTVGVLVLGPERVAAHFAANGRVTRFDDTATHLGLMSLVVIGLVALLEALPVLARRGPVTALNVPNREQWNTPERRALLARLLREDIRLLTAASVLLITGMTVLSAIAGAGDDIPPWAFPAMFLPFVAAVLAVLARVSASSRYAPPADEAAEGAA